MHKPAAYQLTRWAWPGLWCLVVAAAPVADRDRDGVVDTVDQCPDEPEDNDGFVDGDGCPDPDNDGDSVADREDRCPNVAGDPQRQGCPRADRDADGVPDDVDECPDFAEDKNGVRDNDGCPDGQSGDSDRDGVPDGLDACPTSAEDFDGFEDNDGCPDPDNDLDGVLDMVDTCPLAAGDAKTQGCPELDRDHDAIRDESDACPDVPGEAPSGCPKKVLVVRTANKIEIRQQINFAANRAMIRRNDMSFDVIDQIAAVLRANPTLHVTIEGHTDNAGEAARNLQLSDDRAHAVRTALIERNIEPNRLDAVGYGESKPVAPNKSPRGRSKNRRVEFTIVQKAAAPK